MKITLIITTYNWPEALLLVITSVKLQTVLPDEIIIADDGSTSETKDLINSFNKTNNFNIIHSWQEDIGFRASRSRNNAILQSDGDYIILIDGDTILHHNFVEEHVAFSEPGFFVQGNRVLISEKKTQQALIKKTVNFSFFSPELKNRKNLIHSKLLALIFSSRRNHLRGIKSCNMAFYKKDCLKINGFNNDFEGWGREDTEFVVRLNNIGIKRKSVRFHAIQLHLWHNENSRLSIEKNDRILDDAINNHTHWCENGINSVRKNES